MITWARWTLILRRAHMYCGLLLWPWVMMYGLSALLMNHPTFLADHLMSHFRLSDIRGTALEQLPSPQTQAEEIVAELNRRNGGNYQVIELEKARFNREFAFAIVKQDGQFVNILVDAKTGTGTIRSRPDVVKPEPVVAPFATARPVQPPAKSDVLTAKTVGNEPIRLADPLHTRMTGAIPGILTKLGFPSGAVVVTSVPDVIFRLRADGRDWQASYQPMTGVLIGQPLEHVSENELSTRLFLLRLHTAHGYPDYATTKWYWAASVDLMAIFMLFWASSGLVMWWQIKSARKLGAVVLTVSGAAATYMAVSMHDWLRMN